MWAYRWLIGATFFPMNPNHVLKELWTGDVLLNAHHMFIVVECDGVHEEVYMKSEESICTQHWCFYSVKPEESNSRVKRAHHSMCWLFNLMYSP